MIVRRTLDKIEELKTRPHDERRAVAAAIAIGVAVVLFLGWGIISLATLRGGDSAHSAAVIESVGEESEGAATTTGARVRIQNESAAAGAASGYFQFDEEGYQVVPASE